MKSSLMLPDFPIIIADESVDFRIIQHLREKGYSVYSIITESPGIADINVIEIAIKKQGYIITEDKDFGDELVYKRSNDIGSMLLRLQDIAIEQRTKLVTETLSRHANVLKDSFAVLTPTKLRIRKYI